MKTVMSRRECPICGRWWDLALSGKHSTFGKRCPGVPVKRTYIAIEALLSDKALGAADRATHPDVRQQDVRAVIEAAIRSVASREELVAASEGIEGTR